MYIYICIYIYTEKLILHIYINTYIYTDIPLYKYTYIQIYKKYICTFKHIRITGTQN